MRFDLASLDARMRGGLCVSCQPVDGGPLDDDAVVARLARAAALGGAAALRIEGAGRVAAVRAVVELPLIGIIKRDLPDFPVRITPWLADVTALAAAGADVIAVDATQRARPVPVAQLLAAIRAAGCLAMADASCPEDALAAARLGFDIVGTTLSGYTGGGAVPSEPDFTLIHALAGRVPRLMAEGRFNTPEQAARARRCGAWAVTVGTAITRTESVVGWFSDALRQSASP